MYIDGQIYVQIARYIMLLLFRQIDLTNSLYKTPCKKEKGEKCMQMDRYIDSKIDNAIIILIERFDIHI